MATMVIYNSFMNDLAKGNIDLDTDTFKGMIVTSAYTPNSDTHTKRSDITNEIAATGGYSAGGFTATLTVPAIDTANDREDVSLGGTTYSTATITGRKVVYYKSRGGASSADELVCCIDWGSDIASTGGNFVIPASTLRFANQNP